jgi:hypothetical protein
MPAILASEICWLANIWGMAKNARPPYRPNDAFDNPMTQIGGAILCDGKQVSGNLSIWCCLLYTCRSITSAKSIDR